MKYKVRFTKSADDDFDEIIEYIFQNSPENAIKFAISLKERTVNILSSFPNTGTIFNGVNFFTFDNYIVVYDIDEVANIVHVILISERHRQWESVLVSRT